MSRRRCLWLTGTWVLIAGRLSVGPAVAAEPGSRRPNMVVIVADDLGYADLGCYGAQDIPTPHIDRLAREGVRCTDAYAAAPVGGPSRAALLTGRYPQRFGFEFNPPREVAAAYGLPATETTLAELLERAGYVTGLIGKWHLGRASDQQPQRRGFREFFGFLDGAHYYLDPKTAGPGGPELPPWPNGLLRGTTPVEENAYLTDAFTREAVSFIDRNRAAPFFLLLAYNAPHAPLEAPDSYLERVRGVTGGDHRRHVYAAMIAALDDGVGAVAARIAQADLRRDTMIVFVGDNGGITGYLSPSSNRPLSGAKTELLEGGIRVPFILQWPGQVPTGVVYGQPVSLLDVFATVVAAAGTPLPAVRPIDGVDLLPFLSGRMNAEPHPDLYWRYGPHSAIRAGRYKLVRPGNAPAQLFDVSADVSESHDLAAARPDEARRLEGRLNTWNAQLVPPAWNKANPPPWW